MSYIVLFLLVVVATHIPSLTPSWLGMDSYAPDLWVLLVLYIAFRARGYTAVGWGIGIGIVRDAVGLDALGTSAFTLGLIAWLFAEGRGQRGRIEGGVRVVLTFVGVIASLWIYAVRVLPLGGGFPEGYLFGAFPVALWSTVLAAGLYPLLDRYHLLDDIAGRTHALPA